MGGDLELGVVPPQPPERRRNRRRAGVDRAGQAHALRPAVRVHHVDPQIVSAGARSAVHEEARDPHAFVGLVASRSGRAGGESRGDMVDRLRPGDETRSSSSPGGTRPGAPGPDPSTLRPIALVPGRGTGGRQPPAPAPDQQARQDRHRHPPGPPPSAHPLHPLVVGFHCKADASANAARTKPEGVRNVSATARPRVPPDTRSGCSGAVRGGPRPPTLARRLADRALAALLRESTVNRVLGPSRILHLDELLRARNRDPHAVPLEGLGALGAFGIVHAARTTHEVHDDLVHDAHHGV